MKLCFLVGGKQQGCIHVTLTVYFVAFPKHRAAAKLNQRHTDTHTYRRERDVYTHWKWKRERGRDSLLWWHDMTTTPSSLRSVSSRLYWFSFISFLHPYFLVHFLCICLGVRRGPEYHEAPQHSEPLISLSSSSFISTYFMTAQNMPCWSNVPLQRSKVSWVSESVKSGFKPARVQVWPHEPSHSL